MSYSPRFTPSHMFLKAVSFSIGMLKLPKPDLGRRTDIYRYTKGIYIHTYTIPIHMQMLMHLYINIYIYIYIYGHEQVHHVLQLHVKTFGKGFICNVFIHLKSLYVCYMVSLHV